MPCQRLALDVPQQVFVSSWPPVCASSAAMSMATDGEAEDTDTFAKYTLPVHLRRRVRA